MCKYYLHDVGFLNVYYLKKCCSFPCNECVSYSQKRDILQSPSLSWISWFAFYEKFYNSPWTCTSSNCMPYTRREGLFIQGGLLGFKTKFLWSLPTMLRWEHSVKEAKLCNHTAQHICTLYIEVKPSQINVFWECCGIALQCEHRNERLWLWRVPCGVDQANSLAKKSFEFF